MGTTSWRKDASWRRGDAAAGRAIGVAPTVVDRDRARRLRRWRRWIAMATLLVSDAAMVTLALLLAWYVRIGSGWIYYGASAPLAEYERHALMAALILIPVFAATGLYDFSLLLGGTEEYAAVFRASAYGMIGLIFLSFWERGDSLSRGWLLLSWALTVVLVGGARFGWRRVFHRLQHARGWFSLPTLIVGANEHARAIARQIEATVTDTDIVGFVDDFLPEGTPVVGDRRVLGPPRLLHELVVQHGIERVIVLPNAVAWETFQDVIRQKGSSNGFELQVSPGFYEILTASVQVTNRGFVPLLRVDHARIVGVEWLLKTALDFGLGALLVLVTAPLTAAIAAILWCAERRSPFERHHVLGLGGQPFRTTKFRTGLTGTMERRLDGAPLPDPDGDGAAAAQRRGEARGRRLRSLLYRSGLDKLPQLVDVLRGRLSLVGPRTISVGQEARHDPWLSNLLTVKPGWTGPWAVGNAHSTEEEMRLDLFYIRNWTIWLDLQILLQTGRKAVSRRSREAR